MKKIFAVCMLMLLIAAALFARGDQEAEAVAPVQSEDGYTTVQVGDIKSGCKIEGDRLFVTLSAPTKGWISVGFKPGTMMKDANIIIGYVAGGELVLEDHFGVGNIAHKADTELGGTMDVEAVEGSESDGATSFTFSIPLDSGDEYDQPLAAGETVKIILAYAGKDDFKVKHGYRTSTSLELK